jgi:hypothetical protein
MVQPLRLRRAHPGYVFCAESGMGSSVDLQMWAARLCLGMVGGLGALGFHFGNVRFAPVAAGFGILAGVLYTWKVKPTAPFRSLSNSGSHRAL